MPFSREAKARIECEVSGALAILPTNMYLIQVERFQSEGPDMTYEPALDPPRYSNPSAFLHFLRIPFVSQGGVGKKADHCIGVYGVRDA